jgi:hypothetical protein
MQGAAKRLKRIFLGVEGALQQCLEEVFLVWRSLYISLRYVPSLSSDVRVLGHQSISFCVRSGLQVWSFCLRIWEWCS